MSWCLWPLVVFLSLIVFVPLLLGGHDVDDLFHDCLRDREQVIVVTSRGLFPVAAQGVVKLGTGPRSEHLEEGGHQRNRFIHPCFVCRFWDQDVSTVGRSFGWQSLKDTPSPRLVSSRLTLFVAGVQCRRGRVVLRTNRVPVRDAHLVLENVPVVLAVNSGGSASGFVYWMVLLRARSAAHLRHVGL